MGVVIVIITLIAGYFIGSISPAIMIGRIKGTDIRNRGSGNAGSTNVLRVFGAKAAVVTLLVDVLKGAVAVWIGGAVGGLDVVQGVMDHSPEILAMFTGYAAMCGHNWPILFNFKGGKGVATACGVLLAVNYIVALVSFGILALVVLVTKRVSAGSVLAAAMLPLTAQLFGPQAMNEYPVPYIGFALAVAVTIILKHRANIQRIAAGTEPKISFKKKEKSK